MANVYLEEGSLENAYILYLKFMTLFLEKIRKHPDFPSVTANEKAVNQAKIREVLPKAENLKAELLERYTKEYDRYIEEAVSSKSVIVQQEYLYKIHVVQAQRRISEQKKLSQPKNLFPESTPLRTPLELKVPTKLDAVNYPDPDGTVKSKPHDNSTSQAM